MAYTLVVGHQEFADGDRVLSPGDPIPEADHWPHIEAYINQGEVFILVDDLKEVPLGVDPHGRFVFTSREDIDSELARGRFYGALGGPENPRTKAKAEGAHHVSDGDTADSTEATPAETAPAATKAPATTKATKKKA